MKILVTGKLGQVGRCLTRHLNEKEYSFVAFSREELDITDARMVESVIKRENPDIIINAAAYTAVDKAESDQECANTINHLACKYLAQVADAINATLLHVSTDYVFSGEGEVAYTELDATEPRSVYGRTKRDGELAIQQHCKRYIILRTAWVFGEQGNNFVKTMLRLGGERSELNIVADQFGAPTAADDIASALIKIAKQLFEGNTDFGIYHYSGMPYINWYEFAIEIFNIAKAKGLKVPDKVNPINSRDYPALAKRPANSRLDNQKIYKNFGITPSNWRSALEKMIG